MLYVVEFCSHTLLTANAATAEAKAAPRAPHRVLLGNVIPNSAPATALAEAAAAPGETGAGLSRDIEGGRGGGGVVVAVEEDSVMDFLLFKSK